MFLLNADLLQLVTSSSATIDAEVYWSDNTTTTFTPSRTVTLISSATTTTICAGPAASTQRVIKSIKIRNRHASTSNTIIVKHYDGVSTGEQISYALAAGETLQYVDGGEYKVIDALGRFKTSGTASIADGSITLANLADLAQDQFIGRVTASTGVPETATITAAARTVLDDTTVGAMVNTLGGATSTGTGGLVRLAGPTFTGTLTADVTTFTGQSTFTLGPIVSALTASRPVFSDGTKTLVSNAMTGTGNVMMSASPTTTGTLTAAIANFSGLITASNGFTLSSGRATLTNGTLTLPSNTTAETTTGTFRYDTTESNVFYYNSQREIVQNVGWAVGAHHMDYSGEMIVDVSTSLAINGGTRLIPIMVYANMLVQDLYIWSSDTAAALRTAEWRLYRQRLNNGNAGENTINSIVGVNGTFSFTPAGAATFQSSTAATPGTYIGPGIYWLAIRNTSATNTFGLGVTSGGTLGDVKAQTKTLGSGLSTTLDAVAATWTQNTGIAMVALSGRVFGQTTGWI